MAEPRKEKRTHGYILVVTLVVAALLAAIPVFLWPPVPVLGPRVLLVRATDTISAVPGTTTVEGDFGPHCTAYEWDGRGHFLAVETDADLTGVAGILLQGFVLGTQNFATGGGDLVRATLTSNGSAWQLTSPVDNRTLLVFVSEGDSVRVGGTAYGPGDRWALRLEYQAIVTGDTVSVVEDIEFENVGFVDTHIVPEEPCA